MKIYLLLPVYNEGPNIEPLLKGIKKCMEARDYLYEVIIYNDGSTDETSDILGQNRCNLPVRIIGKEQNEGLGFAFKSLIKEVINCSEDEDDIAIVLDSDNSHNPEHTYRMVNRIREGFDVVIASRYLEDSRVVGVSKFRQFLSLCASWFMRIIFPIKGIKDYTCGYRAYSVTCLSNAYKKYGDKIVEEHGFACMAEFLIKLSSLNVLAVEIPLILRYDRKRGESKMKILKTIENTIMMLLRLRFFM